MTSSKNADKPAAGQAAARQPAQLKATQAGIAKELRRYFDDVVNEPVPDNFLDLLRQLDGDENNGERDKRKDGGKE